ncbi:hypothetical protein ACIQB4_18830 [Streptomyces griseoluteus]|uniref:hypothetical protein n=1 Tax=Streptomyces griseoluteus TaxID=29306 RepID=UPI00382A9875
MRVKRGVPTVETPTAATLTKRGTLRDDLLTVGGQVGEGAVAAVLVGADQQVGPAVAGDVVQLDVDAEVVALLVAARDAGRVVPAFGRDQRLALGPLRFGGRRGVVLTRP